jgi:hypothetical protein
MAVLSGCSMTFQSHLQDNSIGGRRADIGTCSSSRKLAWVDAGMAGAEFTTAAVAELSHDHGGRLSGDTATAVAMVALSAAFVQMISADHGFRRAAACRDAQTREVTAAR